MVGGALVALLNTTNNRCYSTLREFFVPHQRLLVLLRLRMEGGKAYYRSVNVEVRTE